MIGGDASIDSPAPLFDSVPMQTTRHPRNRDFEWIDHSGPYRYLSEEQVAAYDEHGFVVLEDVFDADTVAEAIAAIDPVDDRVEGFLEANGGKAFIARAGEITWPWRAPIQARPGARPAIEKTDQGWHHDCRHNSVVGRRQ